MEDLKLIDKLVHLDPNRLDDEWVGQPRLYFRFAVRAADSRKALDDAKNRLEVVKADLDKQIRSDPGAFGLPKLTEGAISAAIVSHSEYQAAHKAVVDAKHEADIYSAALAALEHRKKALESLVSLFLADYYSNPRAPVGAEDKVAELEKRAVRRKVEK